MSGFNVQVLFKVLNVFHELPRCPVTENPGHRGIGRQHTSVFPHLENTFHGVFKNAVVFALRLLRRCSACLRSVMSAKTMAKCPGPGPKGGYIKVLLKTSE